MISQGRTSFLTAFVIVSLITGTVGASNAAAAAPGRVTLLTPSSFTTTNMPTFSWLAVSDATYYLLRVTDWTETSVDRWYTPAAAGCPLGSGVCSASLGVPLPPGPATWKVLAWSPAGYGPWSDVSAFSIEIGDPLATAPQPIAPTGTLWLYTATYTWTPVSGAVLYRLWISRNGGPATQSWYTPAALGCVNLVAPCGVGLTAPSNGTAEWKIQAWTVSGHSDWSASLFVSFTVFPAPLRPTGVAPAGPAGPSPTFTWIASENVIYYYIRVDDVTGRRVDQWLTPAQAGCSSGSGTCTFIPAVALNTGVAQWQVLAWNPSGYSPWSSLLAFTVSSGPPVANPLPGPVTRVAPAGPVSTSTPTFTWSAMPNVGYYLVRATDWTETTIDRWYTPAAAGCPLGSGVCSASLGVPLAPGPVTWKILAWNLSGYGP